MRRYLKADSCTEMCDGRVIEDLLLRSARLLRFDHAASNLPCCALALISFPGEVAFAILISIDNQSFSLFVPGPGSMSWGEA